MSFQYQRPIPLSFREGRQALSASIARASQNKQNMMMKLAEKKRTQEIAAINQEKKLMKERFSSLNGFDLSKISIDDADMFGQWLNWTRENVADMSAEEFARNLDGGKRFYSEAQEWYGNATKQIDELVKMSDGVYRGKQNAKADGFVYDFTNEDYEMKQALYERPFSRNPNPPQGQFDPSRMGFVGPNGFQPITRNSRFDYNNLGPMIGQIEEYNTLTELYNGQKRGSAKTYYNLLQSSKTEERTFESYNPSAVAAYHDTVWKFRNHRRSLINQYETEQNSISSDASEVILNESVFGKIDALKLASDAGLEQSVIDEINSVYDFGMEKTLEWGRQAWKPKRETDDGSGSGSGGSSGNRNREPDITQTSIPAPWYEFSSGAPVAEQEVQNIGEAGGFRAFNGTVTVKDTSTTRTNIPSADLKVESFAMDSRYRLHVYLSVPERVKVWRYMNTDYFSEEDVRAAKYAMVDEDTPLPTPKEIVKYKDEFVVLRPFNMINSDNNYVKDQWSMTESDEDDLYNNILRKIGYHSLTALGREEAKPEGMAKIGFRYLKEIYNK